MTDHADSYMNNIYLGDLAKLDQIRARFQPRTRGGHEYEIFAERGGVLYGRIVLFPAHQDLWESASWSPGGYSRKTYGAAYDLIPRNPHEELIAECRKAIFETSYEVSAQFIGLMTRLIEALEQEVKK